MIITLNDYTINNNSGAAYISDDIQGLEMPEIRTSSGNYAGRDGGYVGAQFYGSRAISLLGRLFSSDIALLETARVDLQKALRNVSGVTMKITTNAGSSYIVYCRLLDFKMPIKRELFTAPFKIELLAPDPIIYDNATGTELSATVPKLVIGGYTYPVVYPVVYAPGVPPTAVVNAGNVSVFPTITMTGPMTNPQIKNMTTGAVFSLNITTAPGDVVAIDMRTRTVTLNGGDVFPSVAASSTFWYLIPGSNLIQLTTSTAGDTVTSVLQYRAGFIGI